jgi:hypothetical protein
MATAAARQFSRIESTPVLNIVEIPFRPALELVPENLDTRRQGLVCRWRFDPVERRLVAHWEQGGR